MKRILIILFLCGLSVRLFSQISTGEIPISFGKDISLLKGTTVDLKTMPPLDMKSISEEDLEDEENGIPPRFGFLHKVDFNLENSGTWTTLENGDKIWQLNIYCPDALSINFLYDKFWIPEKAKFFAYSENKQHVLGAYTSSNNKGSQKDIQGFATGLVYGDRVCLEYYQPSDIQEQGIISIAYVVHGYRYIKIPEMEVKNYEESGDCQVNINCQEGQNWENEKNAVALILVNGNRYCTGSLINTTANDNRPLFLTADHCLGGWANNDIKYDAVSNPNLNHWSFYWHYESPDCSNTYEPLIISTVGATVVANNDISDFALLSLTENPLNRTGVTPYYLGWDRSGNSGTGGVGIHHPNGDVKKIATYSITPSNSNCFSSGNNYFWRVNWQSTTHGWSVTEGGASGSPLINNNRRVIGQLYGAGLCSNPNCLNPSEDIANYGKFSTSWTGNNNSDNRRRLDHWLDPLGTNPTTLNGMHPYSISGPSTICNQATYAINNLPQGATVQWSVSPAGIVSLQTNGNEAVLTRINAGTINLTSTILLGAQSITISKENVKVSGSSPGIAFLSSNNLRATNAPNEFEVLRDPVDNYLYKGSLSVRITNATSIAWVEIGGTMDWSSFLNTVTVSSKKQGSLTLECRASNACGTETLRYHFGVGILIDVAVYPNPATDMVTVEFKIDSAVNPAIQDLNESVSSGVYEIQLWDSASMLRSYKTHETSFQIPLTGLPKGIYFVRVIKDGETYTQKLIKN